MNIVLIEDSQSFIQKFKIMIESNLNKILTKYNITCIQNSFKEFNYETKIDICFIDIDLKELSGITMAKRIKEHNPNVILIFVSSRNDLVFNTFEVRPFQFIRKSNLLEDTALTFNQLDKYLQELSYIAVFNVNGRITNVLVHEIVYVESYGHNITIHTVNDEITLRATMKEVLDKINSKDILQIQRGFSVNLRYVKGIDKNIIILTTNQKLEIGRKYKQDVINGYKAFLVK